eukprot:scaffold34984_cov101-Isochrysis_galbana.AAC.3
MARIPWGGKRAPGPPWWWGGFSPRTAAGTPRPSARRSAPALGSPPSERHCTSLRGRWAPLNSHCTEGLPLKVRKRAPLSIVPPVCAQAAMRAGAGIR